MAGVQIVITTTGGPKIQEAMSKRSGARLYGATLKATKAAGNAAKPIIQAQAPVFRGTRMVKGQEVRGGATKKSVKVKTLRREVGVSVGPRIWYRHFVIGGTSRGVAKNPWVQRGADASVEVARAAFAAAMKVSVR